VRKIKGPYMDVAICLNWFPWHRRCKHIWTAILPNGIEADTCLECPKCHCSTGVWLKWWQNNRHKPAQKMFWVKGYGKYVNGVLRVKPDPKDRVVPKDGPKGEMPKKPSLSLEHETNPKENGFQG